MNLKDIKIRLVNNGYVVRISGNEGEYFEFVASDLVKATTLLHDYIEDPFNKQLSNVIPIK